VAILYNAETEFIISYFAKVNLNHELIRIVQTTLDGQQYIQRIGVPAPFAEVEIIIDEAQKVELMQADDKNTRLKVVSNSGTFFGKITEVSGYDVQLPKYYKTKLTLSLEVDS